MSSGFRATCRNFGEERAWKGKAIAMSHDPPASRAPPVPSVPDATDTTDCRVGAGAHVKHQLAKFALIGGFSNALLYVVYVALTGLGLTPLEAMTSAYVLGVAVSFVLNGRITFNGRVGLNRPLVRFVIAYLVGYAVNFTGLRIGTANLGVPHHLMQLLMIFITAALLFILQRQWVFRTGTGLAHATPIRDSTST